MKRVDWAKWRRRLKERYPRMLVVLSGAGFYATSVRLPPVGWLFILPFVIYPLVDPRATGQSEPRDPRGWVRISFRVKQVGDPTVLFFICLVVAVFGGAIYFSKPRESSITASLFFLALMGVATFLEYRNKPTHRHRYVSESEVETTRRMVDETLSIKQNVRRVRAQTWGDRAKTRDVVLGVLGLARITPLVPPTPYPRLYDDL